MISQKCAYFHLCTRIKSIPPAQRLIHLTKKLGVQLIQLFQEVLLRLTQHHIGAIVKNNVKIRVLVEKNAPKATSVIMICIVI